MSVTVTVTDFILCTNYTQVADDQLAANSQLVCKWFGIHTVAVLELYINLIKDLFKSQSLLLPTPGPFQKGKINVKRKKTHTHFINNSQYQYININIISHFFCNNMSNILHLLTKVKGVTREGSLLQQGTWYIDTWSLNP